MSKRPLAWRHLARLLELTGPSSMPRVAVDRKLVTHAAVVRAAATDRGLAEEVVALGRDRGWSLPEPEPFQWTHVGDESNPIPRLLRVIDRDVFELDELGRRTDDEEVRSLALQLRAERLALLRTLEAEYPACSVPGAK